MLFTVIAHLPPITYRRPPHALGAGKPLTALGLLVIMRICSLVRSPVESRRLSQHVQVSVFCQDAEIPHPLNS